MTVWGNPAIKQSGNDYSLSLKIYPHCAIKWSPDKEASMKVKDVMRKEVVTVDPEASLRSAARLIFSGHLGGLPVVNKGGKLVGIVVEKDILTLFFPSLKAYVDDYTHTTDF